MGWGLLFFFAIFNAQAESVQEQAKVVVRAALDSRLIQNDEILEILQTVIDQVLPRQDLIILGDTEAGCQEHDFEAQVPPVLPIQVHTCPSFYQEQSPQTMIHEAIHVVQLMKVLAPVGLKGECLADLAAMEATAVAVKIGAVPPSWNETGYYFQNRMCRKSAEKYRLFLSRLSGI